MILIAPDKFKGTLTAREAAAIIADAIPRREHLKAPMADGGEGTASVLCGSCPWEKRDGYYVNRHTLTAVIDSSTVIGMQNLDLSRHDILKATSAPLGVKVREIIKGGCDKVVIGIGGTSTCDGGMGFLVGLGLDKYRNYKDNIIGLSDVKVPLVAPPGQPSALMFAPQKGASDFDIEILRERLEEIYSRHPNARSEYDGAGGGLGFAIASMIGAECHSGAEYVLDSYHIDWSRISLVITGEGSIDEQTAHGKVVETVMRRAAEHGIAAIAFGGRVAKGLESENIIDTSKYYPELELDSKTAAIRLKAAVLDYFKSHIYI